RLNLRAELRYLSDPPHSVLRRIYSGQVISGAPQIPRQAIVLFCGDRIKLVVVAPGASYGQPEEALAENVDLVCEPLALVLADVYGRMFTFTEPPESGSDDRFVEPFGWIDSRSTQQVPGDVLHDELVKWNVGVKRANHVITVL